MKPLCIDLFCGCFGWGSAFAVEGYRVVGFDMEHLPHHGPVPEGCHLVIQDVLTLHGSQFKDAAVIVASPPCQKYSYMAMPWSRAKAKAAWYRESPDRILELNLLFDRCFQLQAEASEAAGHHIPMVVENVKGAKPWVGPSVFNFGSFHLWGDVPIMMPTGTHRKQKGSGAEWFDTGIAHLPSNSPRRRAASAAIAKIPPALASHIAKVYKPHLQS